MARDPRKMAFQIAGLRACETHLPENERVFSDPYAELFFDDEFKDSFKEEGKNKAELAKYEHLMPGVNGAIVARIRFIDEYLVQCAADGFEQVVIIGAGFDTRAHRLDVPRKQVRFFEVDHPLTQGVKLEKVKQIFGTMPEHVVYVPVVFGADRLDQKLMEQGFRPEARSLFIAEGLLMYIPAQAVDGLLGFVANRSGPGSCLVADYFSPDVVQGTSPLPEAQVLRNFVESEGAPLQFGIPEEEVERFFIQRGFDQVHRVTTAACKEKYFPDGSRNRSVSSMFRLVTATTPIGN